MEPKALSLFIIFLLPALICANPGFWDDMASDGVVEMMNDEELIGQVLMLGYIGSSPSEEFLEWIRVRKIGGVKVFGWNALDLTALSEGIGQMQQTAAETELQIPLFVATDQEGGWVRHVKGETSVSPGNLAIGATGNPRDAFNTGYFLGIELKALGINMNFAPTVDVYIHPQNSVIGPRSFSADPITTAVLSVAYFRGLEKAGIISTAKHFPGHGNTDKDSHGVLPIIEDSLEILWNRDLVPYRFLVKEGLPAIMSGHLSFPLITGDQKPATLSPVFQQDIIRDRLGFEGVVITDDMQMDALRGEGLDLPSASFQALKAGNDMILIRGPSTAQQEVWERLLTELESDDGFRQRIKEAVQRILAIKYRYLGERSVLDLVPITSDLDKKIPNPNGREFFFDLSFRSVSIIRNEGGLPLHTLDGKEVLLIGQYSSFIEEGLARFPDAEQLLIPSRRLSNSESESLIRSVDRHDVVILCLADETSLEALKLLEDSRHKIGVISTLTPLYLRETPWVRTAIAVYGTGSASFRAGFAALLGDFTPLGEVPIEVFTEQR